MGTVVEAPFGSEVAEVPLSRAPLVFVVAQARFERVASIAAEEFIAGFQEALRAIYPVMRRERQTGVLIGPDGRVVPSDGDIIWRFDERPAAWEVALTPDSVALSTTRYTSRSDFINRLATVLDVARRELRLRFCDRLGVRYVDRLTDDVLLARLPDLVKPAVIGAAGVDTGDGTVEQLHCFSDATFRLSEGAELHARWGLLPAQATFDPAIAASEVRSWVLDIDAYTRDQERFDPAALTERAERLCTTVYRFFRWAVREEFLIEHGGRL